MRKHEYNNTRSNLVAPLFASLLLLYFLTGCSQYKSSWSCEAEHGIGCSSIGYADQVARKHIILNTVTTKDKRDADKRYIDNRDIEKGGQINRTHLKKSLQNTKAHFKSSNSPTPAKQNKDQQTQLRNLSDSSSPTILIREHYSDFEKVKETEVEIE